MYTLAEHYKIDELVRDAFWAVRHPSYYQNDASLLYSINSRLIAAAWRRLHMATKAGSKKATQSSTYDLKFVNRNLTADEKEQHDANPVPFSKLAQEWVKLTTQGYVTKLGWDSYSKCYQATLTVWQSDNPNYGYGLSARGATPERAISLLLFKHGDILGENWAAAYKPSSFDMEG